jgi:hypothetical protein
MSYKVLQRILSQNNPYWGYPMLAFVIEADFKTAEKKFIDQGAEPEKVKEAIELFKELKPKIQKAEERDIDQWAKGLWEEFETFLDEMREKKSGRETKKLQKMEGAELIAESENWLVYKIKSHKACMLYGSGTKWCITEADGRRWNEYSDANDFYFFIIKNPKGNSLDKLAMAVNDKGEQRIYDAADKTITKEKLRENGWTAPDIHPKPFTPKVEWNGEKLSLEDDILPHPEVVQDILDNFGVKEGTSALGKPKRVSELGVIFEVDIESLVKFLSHPRGRSSKVNISQYYRILNNDWTPAEVNLEDYAEEVAKVVGEPKALPTPVVDMINELKIKPEGTWLEQHKAEFPQVYKAFEGAIAEGWRVGTKAAAKDFLKDWLEGLRWDCGSYTDVTDEVSDKIELKLSWQALLGKDLSDLTAGYSPPKKGFTPEFRTDVAYDTLVKGLSKLAKVKSK